MFILVIIEEPHVFVLKQCDCQAQKVIKVYSVVTPKFSAHMLVHTNYFVSATRSHQRACTGAKGRHFARKPNPLVLHAKPVCCTFSRCGRPIKKVLHATTNADTTCAHAPMPLLHGQKAY